MTYFWNFLGDIFRAQSKTWKLQIRGVYSTVYVQSRQMVEAQSRLVLAQAWRERHAGAVTKAYGFLSEELEMFYS